MVRRPRGRALLLGASVAVVLAAAGAALLVLDSPAEERRERLDERRVRDLRKIVRQVDLYWTDRGSLPPDLDALRELRGLDPPPADPSTGAAYPYRTTGLGTYELCATFATDSGEKGPWETPEGVWRHGAGEHCFPLEAEKLER